MNEFIREMTPQQRSAWVIYWLKEGYRLTTAEVAERTGLTWGGAWAMMVGLSGSLPLVCCEGEWQMMNDVIGERD